MRKQFSATALAVVACPGLGLPAQNTFADKPVTLRLGPPMAPGNTVTVGYEKFKEQVERNCTRRPGRRATSLPRKCRPA